MNANGESTLSNEVSAAPAPFVIAFAIGGGNGGGASGGCQEEVMVFTDSTETKGIDGLTVQFNGTTLTGNGGGSGVYTGTETTAEGGAIAFDVLSNAVHYTVSANQYEI